MIYLSQETLPESGSQAEVLILYNTQIENIKEDVLITSSEILQLCACQSSILLLLNHI